MHSPAIGGAAQLGLTSPMYLFSASVVVLTPSEWGTMLVHCPSSSDALL